MGRRRFAAYSAGSSPKDTVHPLSLAVLRSRGIAIEGLRSKSWEEFANADAPPLHFIFTVCDNAAGEMCPIWPGHPMMAHWGIEDPAAVAGSDRKRREAFAMAFDKLTTRIEQFLDLSMEGLRPHELRQALQQIGRQDSR